MVCISAISPIPVPCLSTCMPSFYLGRRCVRQEAITNFADGLSHINNGAKRKPGSPSARSPSRVQIFVSDHPPEPGPAIPGRSTLPTLPKMDSGTLFGSNQHETGWRPGLGALFCLARGWTACFLELPDLLRRRSDATGRLARPPSLRRPPADQRGVSLGTQFEMPRAHCAGTVRSSTHSERNARPRLHLVTLAVGNSGRGAGQIRQIDGVR